MSIALENQLLFQPHERLDAMARAGYPIHVFVNPVEYHGPHLSLGNDRILSERLAQRLHERLSRRYGPMPFIVGGYVDFGCDPCPGVGSTNLTYSQLEPLVFKMLSGLADLGFMRVIVHTFHGSPFHNHAIHSAMRKLRRRGMRVLAVFDRTIDFISHFDAQRYEPLRGILGDPGFGRVMARLDDDFHAGFFETSVALYVAPDTVSPVYRELPDCPVVKRTGLLHALARLLRPFWKEAGDLVNAAQSLGWLALRPFPGYTGVPSLASAVAGEFYVEKLILPRYEQACVDALWGTAPDTPPNSAWSAPLARLIGGRV